MSVTWDALSEIFWLTMCCTLSCQWTLSLASSASPSHVQADLESIRSNLLQRHGAYVNMTADERLLQAAQPLVNEFLQALPVQAAQDADWASTLPRINEAITVPTQVCLAHCLKVHLVQACFTVLVMRAINCLLGCNQTRICTDSWLQQLPRAHVALSLKCVPQP